MEKEELSGQRYKPLLVPILYETDEEMIHARTVREIQIASNFAVLKSSRKDDMTIPSSAKRMKLATNDKEQQQYNLAIETAVLVQKEIEQWENSIRELEIILSRSESQILPTAPPPHHHHHRCPSTHRSVVPDTSDAHGTTIDTITVKDDTTTTTTTHHHRHNSNDDAPIIPHRSISVSSTETRVAVIDEDDMTIMVVPVDTSTPPENVVWETTAAAAVSLSSASSSST